MTRKSTKRSLILSILSMALCLAMLIGSTYAWFSDEATTGDVKITAGNLDVEIVHATKQEEGPYTAGTAYTDQESVFSKITDETLWEPGMMMTSDVFMVKNNGTLALTYQLDVTAKKLNGDKNLLDVVKFKVAKASDFTLEGQDKTIQDRKKAWDGITADKEQSVGNLEKEQTSDALIVVLFWDPTDSTDPDPKNNKDNQYNIKENYTENALKAEFTLSVFATQYNSESDSFGSKYDENLIKVVGAEDTDIKLVPGGEVAFTENKTTSDKPVTVTGSGTVAVDAEVKSAFTSPDANKIEPSLMLGNGTEEADIVLKGKGTVKKTAENQNYGVCIQEQTNVTIESGTYEGIILSAENSGKKAGVLTIKGGKIIGGINIDNDAKTDANTKHIVIEDINAVYEADGQNSDNCTYFDINDKENITLPSGYHFENATGNQWVYIVKDTSPAA